MRMSDWSSDVCSSDLSLSKEGPQVEPKALARRAQQLAARQSRSRLQIFPRSSRIVDDVAIPVDDHMRWRKAFQHLRLHRLPQGGAADGASSLRQLVDAGGGPNPAKRYLNTGGPHAFALLANAAFKIGRAHV